MHESVSLINETSCAIICLGFTSTKQPKQNVIQTFLIKWDVWDVTKCVALFVLSYLFN